MTNEAREAAQKLFDKLNREEDRVATIGVGTSNMGNEILIAYFKSEPTLLPEQFENFMVIGERMPAR